jgi:hypothetical protein
LYTILYRLYIIYRIIYRLYIIYRIIFYYESKSLFIKNTQSHRKIGFVVAGFAPAQIVTRNLENISEKSICQMMQEFANIDSIAFNVIIISHSNDLGGEMKRLTHKDLNILALKISKQFHSFGVVKGDRLLICLRSTQFCGAMYAAMLLGRETFFRQNF